MLIGTESCRRAPGRWVHSLRWAGWSKWLPTQGGLQLARLSGGVWCRVFDEKTMCLMAAVCWTRRG